MTQGPVKHTITIGNGGIGVKILPENLKENPFHLIGKDWMLVAAAKADGSSNMMTASWGGMGVLWNKNVCFVFVRPQRYTYEFCEESDKLTLSFFTEKYRPVLSFCGSKSGRDYDKAAETGLTKRVDEGYVTFDEARLTIKAKKLFATTLKEGDFIDKALIPACYPKKDFHKMYICEIEEIEEK